MLHLVDTNVISELVKPTPDPAVVDWADGVSAIGVSCVTVEEISCGLTWRPNPRVSRLFDQFFAAYCRVFDVSEAVAQRAGWLRGQLRSQGETRTQADMFIAATAQLHGLVVVTRNERDFAGCGVPVLNPFSG